jgi:hypothetical protein
VTHHHADEKQNNHKQHRSRHQNCLRGDRGKGDAVAQETKYKVWIHVTKTDAFDPEDSTDIAAMDEVASFQSEDEAFRFVERLKSFLPIIDQSE